MITAVGLLLAACTGASDDTDDSTDGRAYFELTEYCE